MARLTSDEIKDMAPDRAAFAAAKKLATATNWPQVGQQGDVLWGVCSGSSNYKVYVDLSRTALECSCPSRKRPCKHALALLLLDAADHPMPEAEPPYDHKYEAEDRYYSSWE